MTKQEAMELETICDNLMSEILNTECVVSMALTGKLKVEFDGNFITFKMDKHIILPDYIKYVGYYDNIQTIVHDIIVCLDKYSELFMKLIWSYEHIRELED